jgi:hypothetical protein
VRVFGPYLGSRRVRQAVSGLRRVHPLPPAGPVRSAGERELARARGVSGASGAFVPDRTAALAAVLDRDPGAVAAALAALTARRDAAAGLQAFEAAARLQEEIEAVGWVVAPQRVTAPGGRSGAGAGAGAGCGPGDPADDPADHDVTGWTGDVLVRLRIRGGRVRGWDQEPCARPSCGTRAPAGWEPFLRRNAALAARLAALPVG